MIIDLKRCLDWRWLFDPVLLFILRWSCFFLFLFDSDVWLFMKGLSLEARERSLFGFFLWEVCAKVTWFMLKVGTPENMLSLNSPDFLHHKFNSSTTNQKTWNKKAKKQKEKLQNTHIKNFGEYVVTQKSKFLHCNF